MSTVYLFSAGPRSKPCLVHSPIGPIGPRCSDCHQVWWRKLLTSLKLSLSIGARGSSKTSKSPEVSSRSSRLLVHASQVQLKFQDLRPISWLFVTLFTLFFRCGCWPCQNAQVFAEPKPQHVTLASKLLSLFVGIYPAW